MRLRDMDVDTLRGEEKTEVGRFGEVPFFLTESGAEFLKRNPLPRDVSGWDKEQLVAVSPEDLVDPDLEPESEESIGTGWYFEPSDGSNGWPDWFSPSEVEKSTVATAADFLSQLPRQAHAQLVRVVLQSGRFSDRFDFSRVVTTVTDFAQALKVALRDSGISTSSSGNAFIQDPSFKTNFRLYVDGAQVSEQGMHNILRRYRTEKRRAVNKYLSQ